MKKAIPYFAVWSIRNSFPSENHEYTPFKERKEDDVRTSQYGAIVIAIVSSITLTSEAHLGL